MGPMIISQAPRKMSLIHSQGPTTGRLTPRYYNKPRLAAHEHLLTSLPWHPAAIPTEDRSWEAPSRAVHKTCFAAFSE